MRSFGWCDVEIHKWCYRSHYPWIRRGGGGGRYGGANWGHGPKKKKNQKSTLPGRHCSWIDPIYSVSYKGNRDSSVNLSKSKRQIIKLLSVDDSIFIFLSLWYIGRSYWIRDGCSAIIFVKHVKTVFIQVLSYSTQINADASIVALLWKLPQMPSCSTNNANLDKTNFDMFYKIDCCAAIHDQIWMNYVPN